MLHKNSEKGWPYEIAELKPTTVEVLVSQVKELIFKLYREGLMALKVKTSCKVMQHNLS